MSQAVRQMFDTIAGRYDWMNRFLSGRRDVAWRRRAVATLRELPQSQGSKAPFVLDLCGGTGDFQAALRERWPMAQSVVADFSLPMLAISLEKFPAVPVAGSDALQLPFVDGSFDVVLNGFGMRNLDSTARGLSEIYRVMAPGAQFATLEFFRPTTWFTSQFYALSLKVFPFVGKVFGGGNADAYHYLAASVLRYLSAQEYCQAARYAGFKVLRVRRCFGGVAHIVLLQKA
jgi:demethylmenaquinone methyltransferase/2-methoxy-6-polyprenyl-1,4-benzoquinol methylase